MASTAAQTCVKPSTLASPLNFCTNVSYAVYVPPNVSIEDLDHKAQTAYLASMGNFAQGPFARCSLALIAVTGASLNPTTHARDHIC